MAGIPLEGIPSETKAPHEVNGRAEGAAVVGQAPMA